MKKITDKFSRVINYLRISVTDRCNMRCRYCMPTRHFEYIPAASILSYEDFLYAVNMFSSLGVQKVRVTGGEPLVRKDLPVFLEKLCKVKGIDEVVLTTNASLLSSYAEDIRKAGVKRLNISLDTLNEEKYKFITGGYSNKAVIEGIKSAIGNSFNPVKINVVVIKNFNDDEILDFCSFSAKYNLIVRFIEFMPIGNSPGWDSNNIITGQSILERIKRQYDLEPLLKDGLEGPSKNFILSNGAHIGIITPISNHFCSDCNKIRLTADGKIRPCLLADREVSIFEAIRSRDKSLFMSLLESSLNLKNKDHGLLSANQTFKRTMSRIGG